MQEKELTCHANQNHILAGTSPGELFNQEYPVVLSDEKMPCLQSKIDL